ncbi:hypothetical protein ACLOJK_035297 [Asimina triloba]
MEKKIEEVADVIEEGSGTRLVSGSESRWVDGSEVDSDSQTWSVLGDDDSREERGERGSLRRRFLKKPKRVDSFDVEALGIAGSYSHHQKYQTLSVSSLWTVTSFFVEWAANRKAELVSSRKVLGNRPAAKEFCYSMDISVLGTLALAFQTLGVVYGDLGTSPLYVFADVFSKVPIESEVDVLGALSLVMYTIALLPLAKYVFIVLKANDNGEGGTFALYSLICRYAKVNLLPNQQPADEHISSFRLRLPTPELERALNIKESLERKSSLKTLLLLLVLMGTSMIIGDGILTPAMSVMSAVSGLQGEIPGFNTGAEAMFADVGHFSVRAVQIAFTCVVFPCLLLAYMGQAAYLMKHPDSAKRVFYDSVPGIAEVGVMLVSTTLVTLVMLLIWQTNLFLALCFPLVFGTVELIYLSAVLTKILEGGWLPLVFAFCFLFIMYTWNYGSVLKYRSEMREKVSMDFMLELGSTLGTVRVPGIGLLYNELVQGIPSIFIQFLLSLPAIHSTIVFVCIKYVPVPVVPQEERFLFRRVCPKDYHMFRCIARYGYKDVRKEDHHAFEQLLVQSLEKFLRREAQDLALEHSAIEMELDNDSVWSRDLGTPVAVGELHVPLLADPRNEEMATTSEGGMSILPSSVMASDEDPSLEYELSALQEAMDSGFTYLLAHADVRAKKESWFIKKLMINYFYAFLRRNCRAGAANMTVPHVNIMQCNYSTFQTLEVRLIVASLNFQSFPAAIFFSELFLASQNLQSGLLRLSSIDKRHLLIDVLVVCVDGLSD